MCHVSDRYYYFTAYYNRNIDLYMYNIHLFEKKNYTNHVIKLYRILTPQCATFNLIEQNSLLKHIYIYLDMYD